MFLFLVIVARQRAHPLFVATARLTVLRCHLKGCIPALHENANEVLQGLVKDTVEQVDSRPKVRLTAWYSVINQCEALFMNLTLEYAKRYLRIIWAQIAVYLQGQFASKGSSPPRAVCLQVQFASIRVNFGYIMVGYDSTPINIPLMELSKL